MAIARDGVAAESACRYRDSGGREQSTTAQAFLAGDIFNKR
jgi:hypothetical protein